MPTAEVTRLSPFDPESSRLRPHECGLSGTEDGNPAATRRPWESRHPQTRGSGIQTPTNLSVGAIDQRIRSRSREVVSCRPNRDDRRVCVITSREKLNGSLCRCRDGAGQRVEREAAMATSERAMEMSYHARRRDCGLHKGGSSRRRALGTSAASSAERCGIDERTRSPRRLLE